MTPVSDNKLIPLSYNDVPGFQHVRTPRFVARRVHEWPAGCPSSKGNSVDLGDAGESTRASYTYGQNRTV